MLIDSLMLVVAYVLGSIPVAWLVVRRLAHLDVRRIGSGNVGATNALRATSPAIGLLVALADAGKGALAIGVARRAHASDTAVRARRRLRRSSATWPRSGCEFRGGKGVATASGAFAVLSPLAAGVALVVFVAVVWMTRLVSLGSLARRAGLPAVAWTFRRGAIGGRGALAALIVFRHRATSGGSRAPSGRRPARCIMQPIAVLGAGSWGTALAVHLARLGHDVRLWARDPALVADMPSARENAVICRASCSRGVSADRRSVDRPRAARARRVRGAVARVRAVHRAVSAAPAGVRLIVSATRVSRRTRCCACRR